MQINQSINQWVTTPLRALGVILGLRWKRGTAMCVTNDGRPCLEEWSRRCSGSSPPAAVPCGVSSRMNKWDSMRKFVTPHLWVSVFRGMCDNVSKHHVEWVVCNLILTSC